MLKTYLTDVRAQFDKYPPGRLGRAFYFLYGNRFRILFCYRLGVWSRRGWRLVFRPAFLVLDAVFARSQGVEILPGTPIGPGLRLPHAQNIVIHPRAIIGRNCTIYQNVTIGVNDFGNPGAAAIGNDVIIYPGAVIVGPIRIGDRAVVGANSVVSRDVLPGMIVAGAPAREVRPRPDSEK